MIDEDRTAQLYGYTSDDLDVDSSSKVAVVCDACGKRYISSMRAHIKTHCYDVCKCGLRVWEECASYMRSCDRYVTSCEAFDEFISFCRENDGDDVWKIIEQGYTGRSKECAMYGKVNHDPDLRGSAMYGGDKKRLHLLYVRMEAGRDDRGNRVSWEEREGRREEEERLCLLWEIKKTSKSMEIEWLATEHRAGRMSLTQYASITGLTAVTLGKQINGRYGKLPSGERLKLFSCYMQGVTMDEWDGYAVETPYCKKFNESCRERNREKHGRRCFICGKDETDNGKRLSVHHVDMNKDQGCDDHEWSLVPLCASCHGKAHNPVWQARIEYLITETFK